jgi:hypothetical protein
LDAKVTQKVCDLEDGRVAVTAINWKSGQGTTQNDLCAVHASMLAKNGHTPRRGRKAGTITPKPVTRRPRKKVAARKRPVKK